MSEWDAFPEAPTPPTSSWDAFPLAEEKGNPRDWTVYRAVADVPSEVSRAASENVSAIKRGLLPSGQGERGQFERLADTGKAILAIPGLIASPITGAARSLIGHPLAAAEHAAGQVIAPEIAAKDDPQVMFERARGDVDVAMSGARPNLASRSVMTSAPSIQELKAAGKAGYESDVVKSLEMKPTVIRDFASSTTQSLSDAGLNDLLAPKTFGVLERLAKAPDGSVITGTNMITVRRLLQNVAKSNDPTERLAATRAIDSLDEALPKTSRNDVLAGDPEAASGVLAEARGNFSAAMQAEKIDNKTIQAELRAAAANSGMNVANTVRQRMADVLLKRSEQRGLRPDELAAAEEIVRGTPTQNAMRKGGNILGGGGGLGTAVVAAAGGLLTPGGIGATLPLVGAALKGASNRMTLRQAAALSEMIRSRAPLASSAQKLEEAFAALNARREPKTISAVLMAARNFSNNLRGAGLNISPVELLTGSQSAGTSNADDQQSIPRPPSQ